ncbi:MAG: hypothetical protein ACI8UO_000695 [Verrucomicrobiales bacterium]|jgi:hypothetical protein
MKTIHQISLLLAGLAALGLSSCSHQISYSLTEEDKWGRSHIPGSLRVETFKDRSPRDEKINVRIGDDVWRVNGREGYPGGQIAPGVSKQVARHIDHSGLFEKVYYPGQGGDADYVLTGTIQDYNATGRVNRKAENTVIIGAAAASLAGAAVGAAATSGATTEVSHSVELRDVRLKRSNGGTVWSRGRLTRKDEEKGVHFLKADPPALYNRADDQLKDITEDVIEGMGRSGVSRRGQAPQAGKGRRSGGN